jgi:hypothetical protein
MAVDATGDASALDGHSDDGHEVAPGLESRHHRHRAKTERGSVLDKLVRHRYLVLLTLIAMVPVVVAGIRAAAHGWWPEGDDAMIGLKVADVVSSHPPTMGMRSTSGNVDPTLSSHHPGPMVFYLLAIPAALAGYHPIGLILGMVLIHAALIVGVCIVAHRRGGTLLAFMAMTAVLVVQWTVGPEALFRPLNPYPASIGVFLLLLLTWSLLAGDTTCAWGFVVVASLVAQANLAFVPLAGAMALMVTINAVAGWARKDNRPPAWHAFGIGREASPVGRRALIAFILCWLPAMVEVLTYKDNNVIQVLRYLTSSVEKDTLGWTQVLKTLLPQLAPFPGGFSSANGVFVERPGVMVTLGGVLLLALALLSTPVATAKWTWWRKEHRLASLVVLVALAFVAWSAASAPQGSVGVSWYWLLPVWPTITFAWMVVVWAVILRTRAGNRKLMSGWPRTSQDRWTSAVVLGVVAVAATQSPVVLSWKDRPSREASAIVTQELAKYASPPAPVQVKTGGGWVAWASVGPAVSYNLRSKGFQVYSVSYWPFREDVSFRYLEIAPPSSTQILILEKSQGQWLGKAEGPGWRQIGTVAGQPATGEGELAIYLRTPPA